MNSEYIRSVMIDATEQMHKAVGAGMGTKALNLDTVSDLIAIAAVALKLQANLEAAEKEVAEDLDDPRNFNADEFLGFS